jgi:uncharacterized membrane protein (DUF441 family)
MFTVLMGTLRELLDSKKFVAGISSAFVAILIAWAAKKGFAIDKETADEAVKIIVGSASAFVVSQGIADHGKERVKAEAAATPPAPPSAPPAP